MSTTTLRTPTSFRLETSLLNLLKDKARESHQSLNSFVERILMEVMKHSDDKECNTISPKLQVKIDQARENYKKGNYISCRTKKELHSFLESL